MIPRSLLKLVETTRERYRPRIQGTLLYRVLQVPSRWLRAAVPDYHEYASDGIFFREADLWMCSLLPKKILDWVIHELRPRTLLDIGCGTGQSLEYFVNAGIDAIGVEGSKLAISKAAQPQRIVRWNLEKELTLNRKFDVVFSYEVVEHVDGRHVDKLIRSFANHGDLVVLTAAQPGQGGVGHLNEQPPQYWIDRFAEQGFPLDLALTTALQNTGEIFAENGLVFRRTSSVSSVNGEELGSRT